MLYKPHTPVLITTGKHRNRRGHITQPPGTSWPNQNGQVEVLLDKSGPKDAVRLLFGPSQFQQI